MAVVKTGTRTVVAVTRILSSCMILWVSFDHFHFLLGIAVVQKIVDMGQAVVGDGVWVKLVFGALTPSSRSL